MRTILNKGDEVIIPQPNWTATNWIIVIAGGNPVRVRLQPELGFRWDIEEVRRAITPKTRAILINSPHNPTGGVFERDDLLALLKLAEEHGLYIIADEAYEDIVYEGEHLSIAALAAEFSPSVQERVISAFTFSKSYAMTGWRLGYLACSQPQFCDNAKKMILYTINGVSTPTQHAGVAALNGPQECIADMLAEYRKRRDLLFEGVKQCSLLSCEQPPRGAIYLYAAITDEWKGTDWDLVDHLIDTHGLGCVPGNQFGDPAPALRFCFACSTEMIEQATAALRG
jgi:aspartate aminotransferase